MRVNGLNTGLTGEAIEAVVMAGVVAIDGKTLRRSYDRRSAKAAIYLLQSP